MRESLRMTIVLLTMLLGVASIVAAEEAAPSKPAKAKTTATRGEIVRVGEGQLLVAVKAGKGAAAVEQAFTIAPKTPVSLERKRAKLADLQPGMSVTLGIAEDGVVKGVTAVHPRLIGTFVRLADGAVVLAVQDGEAKREAVVAVAPGASITVDGQKNASLSDLAKGMRITVPKIDAAVETIVAKTPSAAKAGSGGKPAGDGKKGKEKAE